MLSKNPLDRVPRKPQVVLVHLYREDGPLRWLRSGGWLQGNLVAVAERTWRGRPPVQIKNPEELIGPIRVRFSLDAGELAKVAVDVQGVLKRAHESARERRRSREDGGAEDHVT